MKKIVALGAIAALAGGMIFADEPAIDMKVAEFNGNATVKWGMDLDAGQHGFENSTGDLNLKVNLWNEGSKVTEGDGVWGEVKITGKSLAIKNKAYDGDGNVELNTAQIHFGDKVYLGIKSGDTQVGAYKFDGAIRSADNDNAKWLTDVGPANFSQGIVLGYGDDNFGVDVDLRSYKTDATNTNYTSAYGIAAEAKLKDSNEFVSGLAVDAGVAYNLSDNYKIKGDDAATGAMSDAYLSYYTIPGVTSSTTKRADAIKMHKLGYAFNASYKFAIDDTYYVKPAVGFTGEVVNAAGKFMDKDLSGSTNDNNLVVGALFGWGATADANAGVMFLDGDGAKKVTPGVSVVAAIPLSSTSKKTYDGKSSTTTSYDAVKALIVPSVYLGELVENLKFAAYSEIALLNWVDEDKREENSGDDKTVKASCANKDRTTAMAVAAGVSYDIKSDDLTITPKAGIRYANAAYFENSISAIAPLSSNKLFEAGYGKMGVPGKDEKGNNDYFNLKAGVDVNGLIANTTIFAEYASANLLNDTEYKAKNTYDEEIKHYNVKLGTFNIGAKIHF